MISPEKIKELHQDLKNGTSEAEMRVRLKLEGYSDEDIQLALTPKQYDMRPWFFGVSMLCFLVGFYRMMMHQKSFLMFAFAVVFFYFFDKERKRIAGQKTTPKN